jgi:hypothetical protein
LRRDALLLLMDGATVGFLAVAALEGAWLVAAGAVTALYHPRRPDPAPETTSLGEEPPAVVNLLTNGWEVTPEAVPATLLDLAARGLVEIIQVGPDRELIQLRPKSETAKLVSPYEKQLLDHLRKRSVGGVVPAQALTTGPRSASAQWWRRFASYVVADARRRRLSQARYPAPILLALGLGVAILLVCNVLVVKAADLGDDAQGDPGWWAVGLSFVLLLACFGSMKRFDPHAQRDTRLGREVAGRWLGVREAYASTGYDELPPAAVILHERHLAYAAAMGAARTAVIRLPLGAEDDHHAWTSFGGTWRRVRVRYPQRRAGWGKSPARAIVGGAFGCLLLIVPFYATSRWGADLYTSARDWISGLETTDDAANPFDDDNLRWLALAISIAGGLLLTVATCAGIYLGVLPLVRGLLDLRPPKRVRGLVVRRRDLARRDDGHVVVDHFAAIDDGTADEIDAYRIRPDLVLLVDQGDEVEISVTRRLGYVIKVRDLNKAAVPPPPKWDRPLAPPAIAPPPPPRQKQRQR